ncbi:hypothetical protein TNCV_2184431 [Trichonephila clavipes]|nr:hypothetical protein TNCV_2184431 [Trichonephila clavipes]
MDLVNLNYGQVTRMTPELAPSSPNYYTTPTRVSVYIKGEEFLQKIFCNRGMNQIGLRSQLSDLSDDDSAANKIYESRLLEGESSSDESNEGNI